MLRKKTQTGAHPGAQAEPHAEDLKPPLHGTFAVILFLFGAQREVQLRRGAVEVV